MASEGILLNSPEEIVKDPYTENRKQPPRNYNTPSDFDKLNQFLVMDRKVLRFFCVWDDRDSMFGEMRPYVRIMTIINNPIKLNFHQNKYSETSCKRIPLRTMTWCLLTGGVLL